jgi:hypothetical protein
MLASLTFCLSLLFVPPEQAAPAAVAGWLVAPKPASLAQRLRASPFRALAPSLAAAPGEAPWIVTWAATPALEAKVWQDPNSPPSAQPLAQDATYERLTSAGVDVAGRVDVPRAYGALSRGPRGAKVVQTVRRLGLELLQEIVLEGRLTPGGTWESHADIGLPLPRRGIAAALGPPVSPVWPATVPKGALGFTCASVLPGPLWQVLEAVAVALYPLELSLVRVQMDALEDSLRKRWADDILGTKPRLWTWYVAPTKKGGPEPVWALEVADGLSAFTFVHEGLGMVSELTGGANAAPGQVQGAKTLVLRGREGREVHAAFRPDAIVLAQSGAALEAHLARRGKAAPLPGAGGPSVAFGVHDDPSALAAALSLRGALPKAGLEAVGRSTWSVQPTAAGFHVDAVTRPARP